MIEKNMNGRKKFKKKSFHILIIQHTPVQTANPERMIILQKNLQQLINPERVTLFVIRFLLEYPYQLDYTLTIFSNCSQHIFALFFKNMIIYFFLNMLLQPLLLIPLFQHQVKFFVVESLKQHLRNMKLRYTILTLLTTLVPHFLSIF